MDIFRTEQNVPEHFVDQSRDFQVLCRLSDFVVNMMKFDNDTIPRVLDPWKCRNSMLPLLATKVGFFTKNSYNDTTLRYIISSLPELVKNKGSLLAIKQAIYLYLKTINFRSGMFIEYTETGVNSYGIEADDHTLIIGIEAPLENIDILKDIMRYILPIGIKFQIVFYSSIEELDYYLNQDNLSILYTSDSINSLIASGYINTGKSLYPSDSLYASSSLFPVVKDSEYSESDSYENKAYLLGAVDTSYIISNEAEITFSLVNSNSNVYNSTSNFRGVFVDSTVVPGNPVLNDIYTVKNTTNEFIYDGTEWVKYTYKGMYLTEPENPTKNEIISLGKSEGFYVYSSEKSGSTSSYHKLSNLGTYDSEESCPWYNAQSYNPNGVIYSIGDYITISNTTYKCIKITSDNFDETCWEKTPNTYDYYLVKDSATTVDDYSFVYYTVYNGVITKRTIDSFSTIKTYNSGRFPSVTGITVIKMVGVSHEYYDGTSWKDFNYPIYMYSLFEKDGLLFDSLRTYNYGDYCLKLSESSSSYTIYVAVYDGITGDWDETKWQKIGEAF